jgi:hypothetical protein
VERQEAEAYPDEVVEFRKKWNGANGRFYLREADLRFIRFFACNIACVVDFAAEQTLALDRRFTKRVASARWFS